MTASTLSLPPSPAGHGVHRPDSASLAPHRRGRLKNGNRSGDFLTAPRCGARTRCGGECRQPAMSNGRCRLHGGLSTGPRTPAGLARSRRARWKHGARSAQVRALVREARRQLRRTRALRARLAGSAAGHGVHRTEIRSQKPEARKAPTSKVGLTTCESPLLTSGFCVPASDLPAGHGVHRSISQPKTISVHPHSPAAKSASPAWHGVHRSFRERLRASASLSAIVPVLRSPAQTNR
jgi:hypothetical protein